jgi:NAD(P)-dependent dehydrogenase (short-subunit alcohol dehydrogenase family)
VQIARDRERGDAALKKLQEHGPEATHTIFYADLSRISEMKRVSAEIAASEPRIDVLINNAGAIFGVRQLTEDGLELTFALNHLAYFVVTHGLRERLVTSAPARVVNTASDSHEAVNFDPDDLQSMKAYRWTLPVWLRYGGPGFTVHGRSKLCNILFPSPPVHSTATPITGFRCPHCATMMRIVETFSASTFAPAPRSAPHDSS